MSKPMYELKIICKKYGRNDEMIIRQSNDFSPNDMKLVEQYALHYWDCDFLHLEIICPLKPKIFNNELQSTDNG